MNVRTAAQFCARFAAGGDAAPGGAALLEALSRECGADAAVAWLPAAPGGAVQPGEVHVWGAAQAAAPVAELAAAIDGGGLEAQLAELGFGAACVIELSPARSGIVAVAWLDEASAPAGAGALMSLIATPVSLWMERQRLEQRCIEAEAARREAEDQIARTRRTRALGEMASGVVHDFNNSLTSILGFTELALGPLEKGDAFFEDLTAIRMAALDAAALVRRLHDFGRRGRVNGERELVDLRDVARQMPGLARPRWAQMSQCHGVSFEIVVDAQPVPLVHAAVAEIRELLLNLLFNAVDAMPSGGRITLVTDTAPDGWAVISVVDEGTGMSEEVARQIFQPFFSTKGDGGSGLGLSVCRTIANRHGADLSVHSTPGLGATFSLRLEPAGPALAAPPEPVVEPPPVARVGALRVLFVDDQEEVRQSVGEMLRAMGHDVCVVDCGEAAVALAGRQRIDVLITDLGMPQMNGIGVAQRFSVLAPDVPVVLLTGWGIDPDAVRPSNVAITLGKPVTMKTLGEALAACAPAATDMRSLKCS